MKKLIHKQRSDTSHWVGDGFPVRSIFTYNDLGKAISPFLLMDYGGPTEFKPSPQIRGVGEHPHRGFETVTIVYEGEVEHRDSAGGGGIISRGDVQWMTAARGLVHEEKHSKRFSETGGPFEMVQLWVNLPAKDKKHEPRYQGLKSESMPLCNLPENAGTVKVIAGDYSGYLGPAKTFTPINLWDIRLNEKGTATFSVPEGHTSAIFVLQGEVTLNDGSTITEAEIGVLTNEDTTFTVTASSAAKILYLGGEPIREPIVGYGPFVMNSFEEIHEAFRDFNSGNMGHLNS